MEGGGGGTEIYLEKIGGVLKKKNLQSMGGRKIFLGIA